MAKYFTSRPISFFVRNGGGGGLVLWTPIYKNAINVSNWNPLLEFIYPDVTFIDEILHYISNLSNSS